MERILLKNEFQGNLYRFISVEALADICQNQALTLVHHTRWEDPYEGFIYQAIARPENHEEIKKIIRELNPELHSIFFDALRNFSSTLFGQSWTKESDKLWDLYPPNNGGRSVRIQINSESLKKIEATREWEKILAFEIEYVEEPNLKEELSLSIKGNQISFGGTLLRKRKSLFQHEQEVRLTVMDWDYSLIERRNRPSLLHKAKSLQALQIAGHLSKEAYDYNMEEVIRKINKLKNPTIKKVNFFGIENFIESVMVHPFATDEYVETVEKFCVRRSIKFLGKANSNADAQAAKAMVTR